MGPETCIQWTLHAHSSKWSCMYATHPRIQIPAYSSPRRKVPTHRYEDIYLHARWNYLCRAGDIALRPPICVPVWSFAGTLTLPPITTKHWHPSEVFPDPRRKIPVKLQIGCIFHCTYCVSIDLIGLRQPAGLSTKASRRPPHHDLMCTQALVQTHSWYTAPRQKQINSCQLSIC